MNECRFIRTDIRGVIYCDILELITELKIKNRLICRLRFSERLYLENLKHLALLISSKVKVNCEDKDGQTDNEIEED